jgi:hypothetical protein
MTMFDSAYDEKMAKIGLRIRTVLQACCEATMALQISDEDLKAFSAWADSCEAFMKAKDPDWYDAEGRQHFTETIERVRLMEGLVTLIASEVPEEVKAKYSKPPFSDLAERGGSLAIMFAALTPHQHTDDEETA